MNGVHDMGGMHGFGPVEPEPDEPVFHHAWERRTFALSTASGSLRRWNLDMSRSAREQMEPDEYLAATYYERWLWGLQFLLNANGLVTREELEARIEDPRSPAGTAPDGLRALRAEDVQKMLRNPRGARVDRDVPARFKPGDAVRARVMNPAGHTRLPRYCRGKRGVVAIDQGVWVFPDTHAAGQGPKPQHVYSIRFEARELWGPEASARDFVHVDLWDDYLE